MGGRYVPYKDYIDSELPWLGNVPAHWPIKMAKYVFTLQRGHDLPTDQMKEGPYSVYGSNGPIGTHDRFTTTAPSITVGRSGSVGEINYIEENFWAHNTSLYLKHFLNVPIRFVYYLLCALEPKKLAAGTAVGTLDRNNIHEQFVAVPAFREAKAIARFLDHETAKIDTLIEKQQRLIALLKEKRQAVISHAVTKGLNPDVPMKDSGVEWLGEVPVHWTSAPLKYFVIGATGIQMGPFGGMLKDLEYDSTGYKLYGQENTISGDFQKGQRWVTEERYNELSNYHLQLGDIVLTRKGSLGKARLVHELPCPGIIDSDTIRVRTEHKKLTTDYLSLLMHEAHYISEQILRTKRGSILPGLNSETIANLRLMVPPTGEQNVILESIRTKTTRFDDAVEKCTEKIELLQERRTALISAAVTGKIDVRGWEAPE